MGTLRTDAAETQKEMILRFMQENGSITQMQAAEEFGCWRLGARIWDLKADGYQIQKDTVSKKNRYGKAVNFAKYSIVNGEATT